MTGGSFYGARAFNYNHWFTIHFATGHNQGYNFNFKQLLPTKFHPNPVNGWNLYVRKNTWRGIERSDSLKLIFLTWNLKIKSHDFGTKLKFKSHAFIGKSYDLLKQPSDKPQKFFY